MRVALVRLSLVAALAAAVHGAWRTWPALTHERMHLTAAQAAHAAAEREHLPVSTFDRWKARLRPGQRWWIEIPPGAATGLTNRGAVYRTFGLSYFLPNLPASSAATADVVFRLHEAR